MIRVASVGDCMLELQARGSGWALGHAGDTFNTLWMMRALLPSEAETDFVTAFGDDPFSDRQRDFMAAHGIGTAASPRLPGLRPGLYAITLDAAGERSFTYWRADSAARRLAEDPGALRHSFTRRDLIHVSGITLAILTPAARRILRDELARARAAGAKVSFDPNWRPALWPAPAEARAAMTELLKITDIALPSWPDEGALFGDPDAKACCARLMALGVREVALKLGAEGAWIAAPGTCGQTVPACPGLTPLDTTGAGDGFNGAYLTARLSGEAPVPAALIANRLAGMVIGVYGALADPEALRRCRAEARLTPGPATARQSD
ncbi:sugar kinase [Pararhodobacter marinus]|uniref:sugar kinase n=1 Tax=Pararhodobacter marinus TaxID=2184063 RepID=UPI0035198866